MKYFLPAVLLFSFTLFPHAKWFEQLRAAFSIFILLQWQFNVVYIDSYSQAECIVVDDKEEDHTRDHYSFVIYVE